MKNKTARMIFVFALVLLCFTSLFPAYANPGTGSGGSSSKKLLLYVGNYITCDSNNNNCKTRQYPTYSTSDINKLTNVDEFVILPQYNYSVYSDGSNNSYNILATAVSNMVQTIQSSNKKNLPIWIATPAVDQKTPNSKYQNLFTPFKNYLSSVQTKLGSNWKNVVGIYFDCESVFGALPSVGRPNDNANIKLMSDISNYVHNSLYKQMLWIPYYGNGNDDSTQQQDIAYVANTTSIFDQVLIQPVWYFDYQGKVKQTNLNGVYNSVIAQEIRYPNNGVIYSKKPNATAIIGVLMEIDQDYFDPTDSGYYTRYNDYVSMFRSLRGSHLFGYYAGSRNGLFATGSRGAGSVYGEINKFYNF